MQISPTLWGSCRLLHGCVELRVRQRRRRWSFPAGHAQQLGLCRRLGFLEASKLAAGAKPAAQGFQLSR
ncbi:hypothetical protein D3C85_1347790 [compost metagenome]